jgi:MFS family permease
MPCEPARPPAVPGLGQTTAVTLLCFVVQALSSFIALSVPVLVPSLAVAHGLSASLVGYYPFFLYLAALSAAFGAARFLHDVGPMKIALASVAVSALGLPLMLASAAPALVFGALVIGVGYGPVVPATSQVLSAGANTRYANLIFSLKQTGAPVGGLAAGVLIPPMIADLSLPTAILTLVGVSLVACLLLSGAVPFADRDVPLSATRPRFFEPILAVLRVAALRPMVAASFTYSGMQLCLGAFLPVYLVERQGLSLAAAGWVFGVSQVGAMVGRLINGWIADRLLSPLVVVIGLGFAMALSSVGVALFTPGWPLSLMAIVACLYGATAMGWNGVLYAEVARLAPPGQSGLMTSGAVSVNFIGVLVGPLLLSATMALTQSYRAGFIMMAAFVAVGAAIGLTTRVQNQSPDHWVSRPTAQ